MPALALRSESVQQVLRATLLKCAEIVGPERPDLRQRTAGADGIERRPITNQSMHRVGGKLHWIQTGNRRGDGHAGVSRLQLFPIRNLDADSAARLPLKDARRRREGDRMETHTRERQS